MFKELLVVWRRMFPTREERYSQGLRFAERHFQGCKTSDELDMLFEHLPLDNNDPFDQAVRDYYRELYPKFFS